MTERSENLARHLWMQARMREGMDEELAAKWWKFWKPLDRNSPFNPTTEFHRLAEDAIWGYEDMLGDHYDITENEIDVAVTAFLDNLGWTHEDNVLDAQNVRASMREALVAAIATRIQAISEATGYGT